MLEPEYRTLASLSNGVSVLDRIHLLSPDILLLDISLGHLSGFDVAKCLRDRHTPAKIIFLSIHEDIESVTAAFDIGAFGYVFKSRVAEDLRKAIAIVWTGGRFVSPTSRFTFPLRELVGNVGRIKPMPAPLANRGRSQEQCLREHFLRTTTSPRRLNPTRPITIKNGKPGIGMLITDVNATKN